MSVVGSEGSTHFVIQNTDQADWLDSSVPLFFLDDNEVIICNGKASTEDNNNVTDPVDCTVSINASDEYEILTADCNENERPDKELDEMGELVITYKCRMCSHITLTKEQLVTHFNNRHGKVGKMIDVIQHPSKVSSSSQVSENSSSMQTVQPAEGLCTSKTRLKVTASIHTSPCSSVLSNAASGPTDTGNALRQESPLVKVYDTCVMETLEETSVVSAVSEYTSVSVATPPEARTVQSQTSKASRFKGPTRSSMSTEAGCAVKCITEACNTIGTGSRFILPKKPVEPLPEQNIHDLVILFCAACRNHFPTMEDCRHHMMKDHSLVLNSTPRTEHGFDGTQHGIKSQNLQRRLKKNSPPVQRNTKCTVKGCHIKFSSVEVRQLHLACHSSTENPRSFKCSQCEERFGQWSACSRHLWSSHKIEVDLFTCPYCETYKTVTQVKLDTHIEIHTEERAYVCDICSKAFKQASQLRNHRVCHLDRKGVDTPPWYASKTCSICFKSYADSKCLKKHIQAVHSKLKPYVCQVCGHSSARKAMLQMHLRQHTGEKPYSCQLCEYRTGDHNSLRRHVMRHSGYRPYRCPHCPYSAIQSNSYKNHLRSKHPGLKGLYNCGECRFRTVSEETYVQHLNDHKHGIIARTEVQVEETEDLDTTNDIPTISVGANMDEVFPENMAAAQLIYSCFNVMSADGSIAPANVTSASTSADGTTQTITIQIPCPSEEEPFLMEEDDSGDSVDTGGITIPADQSC